jgi:hypothetical protein
MALSDAMKKLARIVPGIAGYQNRETLRDTDKAVRLKLAGELQEIRFSIEDEKRLLMEKKDLSLLPALDRITSLLEKTANLSKFSSRGYSGIFDTFRFTDEKIDKLYSFDLGLFDDIGSIRASVKDIHESADDDDDAMKNAINRMTAAIGGLEKKFTSRQDILTSG